MNSTMQHPALGRGGQHAFAIRLAIAAIVSLTAATARAEEAAAETSDPVVQINAVRTERFSYDGVDVELDIIPAAETDFKGKYTVNGSFTFNSERLLTVYAELPKVVTYLLDLDEEDAAQIVVPADIALDKLSLRATVHTDPDVELDRFELARQVLDRCGYTLTKIDVPTDITWVVVDVESEKRNGSFGITVDVSKALNIEASPGDITEELLDKYEDNSWGRVTIRLVATDAERQTDAYRDAVKLLDGRYQRDDSVKPKYEVRRKVAAPSQD